MDHDTLDRAIDSLQSEFERPGNHNVAFVLDRLQPLLAAGHGLAAIEVELRRQDAEIFLVGLPMAPDDEARFTLFHPDEHVDAATLRFSLWVGINGRDEVDQLLNDAELSVDDNLAGLVVTGLLVEREHRALAPDPTVRELLSWLLVETECWADRRAPVEQHLDLVRDVEMRDVVAALLAEVDLDGETRAMVVAVDEFLRSVADDGPRLAFQNFEPLVLEAVIEFLGAPTWDVVAEVYDRFEAELSGDLAIDLLRRFGDSPKYTASQRAVIEAHVAVLESAWEHGISSALDDADHRLGVKYGTPTAEDHLAAYLEVSDLATAAEFLRAAPPSLWALEDEALNVGLRRAATDDALWRLGLLREARECGVEEALGRWTGLEAIEAMPNDVARTLLARFIDTAHGCLRDEALEMLLRCHTRAADEDGERQVAQVLVDHRSPCSPSSRRPYDVLNLGVICSKRGETDLARAMFAEARATVGRLHGPLARGLLWLRVGIFSLDYDDDQPMASHSLRISAEEFIEGDDLVSAAYAFEHLSALYRSLERTELALVYGRRAQCSLAALEGDECGVAGEYATVEFEVESGAARTEFLMEQFDSSAQRVATLLAEISDEVTDEQLLRLECLGLACALAVGRSPSCRGDRRLVDRRVAMRLGACRALGGSPRGGVGGRDAARRTRRSQRCARLRRRRSCFGRPPCRQVDRGANRASADRPVGRRPASRRTAADTPAR